MDVVVRTQVVLLMHLVPSGFGPCGSR